MAGTLPNWPKSSVNTDAMDRITELIAINTNVEKYASNPRPARRLNAWKIPNPSPDIVAHNVPVMNVYDSIYEQIVEAFL
jgi:hypothetical protein